MLYLGFYVLMRHSMGLKIRKMKKEYPETASLCYDGFTKRGA